MSKDLNVTLAISLVSCMAINAKNVYRHCSLAINNYVCVLCSL